MMLASAMRYITNAGGSPEICAASEQLTGLLGDTKPHWPSNIANHPRGLIINSSIGRTRGTELAMATKMTRSGSLASALRPAKQSLQGRNVQVARSISTSAAKLVAMPKEAHNMRKAPRDHIGELKAPIVNPADKYQTKAENLHRYGAWVMGCLPKYVQQFSVWKDELTIYISPSGVIPTFTFLKCELKLQLSKAMP